ncbi:hypothetical protein D3C73_1497270 [compost metagenome]
MHAGRLQRLISAADKRRRHIMSGTVDDLGIALEHILTGPSYNLGRLAGSRATAEHLGTDQHRLLLTGQLPDSLDDIM